MNHRQGQIFANPQVDACIDLMRRVAERAPRVHAITNFAAQVFTANLLLAAGATPSLSYAEEEVEAFTTRADALLVNLGTLDRERRAGIARAIPAAKAAGRPFVLDPVFVDRSPPRLAAARARLADGPAILRCNAAEFVALADAPADEETVMARSRAWGCVVALTGPVDFITDGARVARIENGHPLMARVTAMGCAGTALIAAGAALTDDPFEAATAALLRLGIAGEIAGGAAQGPGTFQPAFLDAIHAADETAIRSLARIS
ncbi:MAG: hydroxyethylthiazole kinase [Salinarimonadaceae bacterium]|nr:MAG: hydroxyethylthiazole kinase [Salinarimonadaceae bacterium]